MKTRGITMSAESVLAILRGDKTQTRRVVKPAVAERLSRDAAMTGDGSCLRGQIAHQLTRCPHGAAGDLLYAREAFALSVRDPDSADERDTKNPADWDGAVFRATDDDGREWDHYDGDGNRSRGPAPWRPAMYMPRWAARIWLRITEVRVERVQAITAADAIAEGVRCWVCNGPVDGTSEEDCACFHTTAAAVPSYQVAWDVLNAKRGFPWSDDPWCWAISFERTEAP